MTEEGSNGAVNTGKTLHRTNLFKVGIQQVSLSFFLVSL